MPIRDLLLSAFILGLLPVALFRPDVGILLWTWVGLMNPHKLTWGFAYDFPFALIIGAVTIVAILISKEPKRLPLAPPVVVLLVLNLWLTFTTIAFSLYPELAWEKWEKVMKIQLFIFLSLVVMYSPERIRALVLVSTYSIAFFGIKGGIYTIMKGGHGMVLGPDGGFIAGNTTIALALTMTLPLMWWSRLQTHRVWLKRLIVVAMILVAVAVLGSYSRGGLLALAAMALVLWFKSRGKLLLGVLLACLVPVLAAFMPEEWYAKMRTIQTYEEDSSASSRLDAWQFAINLAKDRPIGGAGFDSFQPDAYQKWMPGARPLDSHSIWFQVLAEHGYVGLALFILLWILTWRVGSDVNKLCRGRADLQWASDLATMVQVSLIGFWVGGSFLGLAYWDYPYILTAVVVLTRVAAGRQIELGTASAKGLAPKPSVLPAQGR
jgi:probable O-glycosylation ligase (exosortase A-associated)